VKIRSVNPIASRIFALAEGGFVTKSLFHPSQCLLLVKAGIPKYAIRLGYMPGRILEDLQAVAFRIVEIE